MSRKWYSRILFFFAGVLLVSLYSCSTSQVMEFSNDIQSFDQSGGELVSNLNGFVELADSWDGTVAIPLPPVPKIDIPKPGTGAPPKPSGSGKLAFGFQYDGSVPQGYHSAVEEAGQFWGGFIGNDRSIQMEVAASQSQEKWLARARPTEIGNDGLPVAGRVELNLAYQSQYDQYHNYFVAVVIHEFGHVLGIGSLWEGKQLINGSANSYNANTKAGQIYGGTIPIEPKIHGHWDEGKFGNELMTPMTSRPGEKMTVSQMTLAGLADIGWSIVKDGDFEVGLITPEMAPLIASGKLPAIYLGDS
ncbi:MAG TPA: hypothetical protein V6C65_04570 [Allocoleopsis sp.]